MKSLLAGLIALALLAHFTFGFAEDKPKSEGWIQLFNGKNLDGWTPKIRGYAAGENFGDTFRVEDGLLKVRYDKYDDFGAQFGHLFYKEKFSHYRLRVEYRFVDNQVKGGPGWAIRNSGAMIHGQTPRIDGKGPGLSCLN